MLVLALQHLEDKRPTKLKKSESANGMFMFMKLEPLWKQMRARALIESSGRAACKNKAAMEDGELKRISGITCTQCLCHWQTVSTAN